MTRATTFYIVGWRIDVGLRGSVAKLPGSRARLARAASRALEAAGAPAPASLGVILTDDAELTDLNRQHMGEDHATDVLSFPLLPVAMFPAHAGQDAALRSDAREFALPPRQRRHLGDVVVSVERAIAQAREGRGGQTGDLAWSPADELRLLVIHGTLHVCGWDHALAEEEAGMRALERDLLART